MHHYIPGIVAPIVIAAAVSGCATSGQKMDNAAIESLEPGVTTLSEMKEQFGAPVGQGFGNDGNLVVNWVYVHVGAFGIGTEQQSLSAVFDDDKVLMKVSSMNGRAPGARLGY
ncbi:hypothetical protein [Cobetia sp. AM6]|uniref:hypothetical protein n=1 Tax=Cobetia sp. AM6 TaxID=2661553 RepID=UPI0012991FD2|nr:hypothetical protein [Cobetia sp. AM6]BBO55826.1 hypothetical protein CLAM6_11370 [Cobetia sp. AM6]